MPPSVPRRAALCLLLALAACTRPATAPRPSPRPAPPPPADARAGCLDARAAGVVARANRERAARGRAALDVDARLLAAAQAHADDMAADDVMRHEGSDGTGPGERAERAGYAWIVVAENVAAGQPTPEAVMRSWMGSPGHRDNLLAQDVRHVGIGYASRPDTRVGHYWVMMFGDTRTRPVAPRPC